MTKADLIDALIKKENLKVYEADRNYQYCL